MEEGASDLMEEGTDERTKWSEGAERKVKSEMA